LKILKQTNLGYKLPPPNMIILEPSELPNNNSEILKTTKIY
ncbi:8381_t:CDS:1, partial [Acaulospora morrowiae]